MKKIYFILALLVVFHLFPLASAITESHGLSLSNSGSIGGGEFSGLIINVTDQSGIKISSVGIHQSVTAGNLSIQEVGGSVLNSSAITAKEIPITATLSFGHKYHIQLVNITTSWNQQCLASDPSLPKIGTGFNWVNGSYLIVERNWVYFCNVVNITYTSFTQPNPITLLNPSDGFLTNDNNILFNASITARPTINVTNASLYVWKAGAIYNITTNTTFGNETGYFNYNLTGITLGDYIWNILGCYENTTTGVKYGCNFSDSNYSFQQRPFEIITQSFTNNVYETSYQNFNLTITTIDDILSTTSKIYYNGTSHNANTICSAGSCSISANIDIPLTTAENENKSFFWEITLFDGTNSFVFNTSDQSKQQNVTRIHLELQSPTYSTVTLNFTAYDEQNLSRINPFKIGGTFNTWLGSGTVKRNQSFGLTSTSNLTLALLPTGLTQYADANIQYSFNDENTTYTARNYYLRNASLTSTKQNIELYLLHSEDSTSFIDVVQDQKLSPVKEALVYIQRYYPDLGLYKTVQILLTDDNGESVGFYETETVDYKHIITKNGVVLLETNSQKVVGKDVPFTLTFTTGDALGYPWSPFEKDSNILSSLTFNKTTKIITFTYIDSSGATSSGNLLVYRLNNNNKTTSTICDTSSSQSSATIICNLSNYDGSFVAYGYLDSNVVDIINFVITLATDVFQEDGLFIGIFIVIVSGFAFFWNPSAGIIGINAALIFTSIMGLVTIPPLFIFGSIAVSVLAIILLKS